MHVLWKGVDLARFDRAHAEAARKRAELGLAPDDLAVGTVGRLAWQKGIDDLLEAVRRLRPRLPRARFFVAGGGRDAGAVAAAAHGRALHERAHARPLRGDLAGDPGGVLRSASCTSASARPRRPSAPRRAPGSSPTCRARRARPSSPRAPRATRPGSGACTTA